MSNAHVSSFVVTREPFMANSRVHVSSFVITTVPPPGDPAFVHVAHFSVTIGQEAPITDGAAWFKQAGSWHRHLPSARLNGEWI